VPEVNRLDSALTSRCVMTTRTVRRKGPIRNGRRRWIWSFEAQEQKNSTV